MFPVPPVCEELTEESKERVMHTTECDEQGSKVCGGGGGGGSGREAEYIAHHDHFYVLI